jgi:hypothetical protein
VITATGPHSDGRRSKWSRCILHGMDSQTRRHNTDRILLDLILKFVFGSLSHEISYKYYFLAASSVSLIQKRLSGCSLLSRSYKSYSLILCFVYFQKLRNTGHSTLAARDRIRRLVPPRAILKPGRRGARCKISGCQFPGRT